MTRSARPALFFAAWFACATAARAAGGHFDVDDAAAVEPGRCQYETWLARAPAASATGLHFGPACRVGALELGLNHDRIATANETRSSLGPQVKWVIDPLLGPLSAGLVWAAAFDLNRGGRPAHTLYVPVTWASDTRLAFNANLGADWDMGGVRTRRLGLSVEWLLHEKLTLIGERVNFSGDWTSRIGARYFLGQTVSVDLSAARAGSSGTSFYVIGLNHDFAR